jgi:hypothetical protein
MPHLITHIKVAYQVVLMSMSVNITSPHATGTSTAALITATVQAVVFLQQVLTGTGMTVLPLAHLPAPTHSYLPGIHLPLSVRV